MPRPFELDPLFRNLATLPGVGPKGAKLMEKLVGGGKILNLLWHKPVDVIDRRFSPSVAQAPDGKICTLSVRVIQHIPAPRRGLPYRVVCADSTGPMTLVFFNAKKDWLDKTLPLNSDVIVSGKIEHYNGGIQMVHPDALVKASARAEIPPFEPVYPLTAGVTNKMVRKALAGALPLIPSLDEWLDPAHKKKNSWPDWHEALREMHFKNASEESLDPQAPARTRLAYDEFLANQLALALVRRHVQKLNGRAWKNDGHLRQKILDTLPFTLTSAQVRTLTEIDDDMHAPLRMVRLLQGDVGSGKTIIAALAMMNVIECGAQAAIMAPTEILARQHAHSFLPWLTAAGIHYVVLTGRDKGKQREAILNQIESGSAQVIIGTHALFQDDIVFHDLGLAVIDEQHKFGVHQRLLLSHKNKGTDVLVMTATPIPRTLTLTAYGDMEVSRLDEKPPGRKPIETLLIPQEKAEDMSLRIGTQIAKGAQIYWVCPLVEESELIDLQAAETRYDILKSSFGDRVGLIHGRLKPDEKDKVMEKFIKGEISILVATTVIEVGVNVPNATIMVIEQAERFGLAQLHQLRGRVGRGGEKSFCFLVYADRLSQTAKSRLKTMRDTEDGFLIAEKDLELRGGGEILGTRQSGLPAFKLADMTVHAPLLLTARDDVKLILARDPELTSDRGKSLKSLLYLMEQDQAIAYLRAG